MTPDFNEATDKRLLEIAQDPERHSRDERHAAYREFMDRHREYLCARLEFRWGLPDERAEEIANTSFTRLWRHIHRYRPGRSAPRTYLTMIADRLAQNAKRDRSRRPVEPVSSVEQRMHSDKGTDRGLLEINPDPDADPEARAHNEDLRELIRKVIEDLPPHQRPVARLRILEGHSYREIADATGVNINTVKSRLHRARHQMRETIREAIERRPELLPNALSHIAPEARAA